MACFAIFKLEHLVISQVSLARGWYSWMSGCSYAYGECFIESCSLDFSLFVDEGNLFVGMGHTENYTS